MINLKQKIKLGYIVGGDKEFFIKPSHLIVTGITQLSGKTTTLEALIQRSGLKAIVFKTKIGEKSFTQGTETPPFFRDRSDYEFVKSLIEAYAKEKLFLEKGTLMELSKGTKSLPEIKKRVDDALLNEKMRGIQKEIHIRLQHYLENLIPQIQYQNLSKTLSVFDGINIMNLERFTEEAQSLIIQSVADEVLNTMQNVIIVIPEAWKFIPQKYNNPCKRIVESFIRQGAANNNFIWIDSQDMAGVDKIPLKQISTWILGYQAERNEVKHTLDQISLPKKMKPTEDEIMTLRKGHFFVSSYDGVESVYVQPTWMDDEVAISIAKGDKDVDEVQPPSSMTPFSIQSHGSMTKAEFRIDDSKITKDIIELRSDFFNKIQEVQTFMQKLAEKIYQIETKNQEINEDVIVGKVLQKMPIQNGVTNTPEIESIKKQIERINGAIGGLKSGGTNYEIAPLEKIKKEFLNEAKDKILTEISSLNAEQKKIIKFIEAKGSSTNYAEIAVRCLMIGTGGTQAKKVSALVIPMKNSQIVRADTQNKIYPHLKERIKDVLGFHEATEQEIQNVYDHLLAEMI